MSEPVADGLFRRGHRGGAFRPNLRSLFSLLLLSSLTSRFVVYKLPAHSGSGDSSGKGLKYKYMDQSSEGWRDGVGYINSSEGAVGRSLLPLYRDNSSQVTECSGNLGWVTVVGPTGKGG